MIVQSYNRLVSALAVVAGILMGLVTILVLVDVVLRNLGLQPSPHTFTFTEYALLYITFLAAPWLIRLKGNIAIEALVGAMPGRLRRVLERSIALVSAAVCAVLAWYATGVTLLSYSRNDILVASFDIERWIVIAVMPFSFALMTIEFTRCVALGESVHSSEASKH